MQDVAPEILVEESETYARVIFNRAHVRNAITSRMWGDLPKLVRRLHGRRTVRAIVLSGAGGKAFASGADISELPAGESAQLGVPAAKLGAAVNPGVAARLVSLVGPAVAKEILFSGQPLDAQRALQVGLVNQVVPDVELEGVTLSLVRQIGANAPLTIRHAKQAVNWIAIESHRRPPRGIQQHFVKGFSSRDFKEGLEAFLARRPPRFQGR
ncbi:MAG: enoyl-CoA hydratase/isomerase family protein [candidate division NC10 bacterium]|nr:enoyl-CoA hydratase/isomerase family protein [candidate division NC10 bacterium]